MKLQNILKPMYCLWSPTIIHEYGHVFFAFLSGAKVKSVQYSFWLIFLQGATIAEVGSKTQNFWFSIGGFMFEAIYVIILIYIGYKQNNPFIIIPTQWNFMYAACCLYADYPKFPFYLAQAWYIFSFAPFIDWAINYQTHATKLNSLRLRSVKQE